MQEENKKYEMMSLILEMTALIKEMEIEMDKLVQEKKVVKTQNFPPKVIPMVTTVDPSTLEEDLARKVTLATGVPITSSTTSATESSTSVVQKIDEASKLINIMEEM